MNMKCKDDMQLSYLISWIQRQYPTGSRVLGGHTKESDYDYVVKWDTAQAFLTCIGLQLPPKDKCEEYAGSKRFYSFKYRRGQEDPLVNLIVVPDHDDFNAWQWATVVLSDTPPGFVAQAARRKTLFGWALNDAYNSFGLPERAQWPDAFKWEMSPKEQVGLDCMMSQEDKP